MSKRRRIVLIVVIAVVVVVLAFTAVLVVPIILHKAAGATDESVPSGSFPTTVTATGGDGKPRTLSVAAEDGSAPDLSHLVVGEKLVVTGSGFDPDQGIYVAICKKMPDPTQKPTPCLGGIPAVAGQGAGGSGGTDAPVAPGTVQYAPSNWINDQWAWKLFGARGFDNRDQGTFTAYIVVAQPSMDGLDCTVDQCAIYTRDDHTAVSDRGQDVWIPVGFGGQ